MLFHEVYSSYYRTAAIILEKAVREDLNGKELNEMVREHAFGESMFTIPEGLTGEKWRLLHRDFTTPLEETPALPLTLLEKRWMKALLLDPRIQLFEPDQTGLEDVEPLFTPDEIVYYDRYSNGDDYRNPEYIRHFRIILQALRENRNLFISFESGRHTQPTLVVTPYYLEYSEKDDRFRLVAAGRDRRWTINVSRITVCQFAHGEGLMRLKEADTDAIVFELEDRRNALERVLLHFSHLKKETKKLDDRRYRVTLQYDRGDETEMVIRILSFGPLIRVVEPESFIMLLRERIERQKQFATLMPGKRENGGV